MSMQIIDTTDGRSMRKTAYFPSLPKDDELSELVEILTAGEYEEPAFWIRNRVQTSTTGGLTIAQELGAEYTLAITFSETPVSSNGERGIGGVTEWLLNSLETALPEGQGVAMIGLGLGSRVINDQDNPPEGWVDISGGPVNWQWGGLKTVYSIVVALVDRTKTKNLFPMFGCEQHGGKVAWATVPEPVNT